MPVKLEFAFVIAVHYYTMYSLESDHNATRAFIQNNMFKLVDIVEILITNTKNKALDTLNNIKNIIITTMAIILSVSFLVAGISLPIYYLIQNERSEILF